MALVPEMPVLARGGLPMRIFITMKMMPARRTTAAMMTMSIVV